MSSGISENDKTKINIDIENSDLLDQLHRWRNLAVMQNNKISVLSQHIDNMKQSIKFSSSIMRDILNYDTNKNDEEKISSVEDINNVFHNLNMAFTQRNNNLISIEDEMLDDIENVEEPKFNIEEFLIKEPEPPAKEFVSTFKDLKSLEKTDEAYYVELPSETVLESALEAELLTTLAINEEDETDVISENIVSEILENPLPMSIDEILSSFENKISKDVQQDQNIVEMEELLKDVFPENEYSFMTPEENKEWRSFVDKEEQAFKNKYGFLSSNFKPKKTPEVWLKEKRRSDL